MILRLIKAQGINQTEMVIFLSKAMVIVFDVIFNEQDLDRRTVWPRFGPIQLKCL